MAFSGTKDLTQGKPMKLIIGFAIPLMFGVVFQQLYNLVDSAVVGKYLGADKLGAVGSTGSINFLIVGFCLGMCSGFSIPVSQRFGAGDYTEMRRYVYNAVYLTVIAGIVFGIVTSLLCPQILSLMNTQSELFSDSVSYIRVLFTFIPVTMAYNMAAGILRALGDSRTPVVFLVISALINIVLDIVFILWVKLDVAGAAWATIISQAFAGAGCIVVLVRRFRVLRPESDEMNMSPKHMVSLVSVGAPMGLQFSITAIGSVILQTAVNGISKEAVSAIASGGKLYAVFVAAYDALASTMATFAGQNVGARKLQRVNEGLKAAAVIGTVYTVFAIAAMWLFGRSLLGIFLNENEVIVKDYAYRFLKANSAFFLALLYVNIVRLSIQGMGFTKVAMIAGTLEMIARAGVALLLVPAYGYSAVIFANPAAWIFADLFLFPCYKHTMQRLEQNMMLSEK